MRSNGRAFQSLQAERIAKVAVLNYIGLVYALIFGVSGFQTFSFSLTPLEVIEETETAIV